MEGWKDGGMEGKAGLRIAYSNQKEIKIVVIDTAISGKLVATNHC